MPLRSAQVTVATTATEIAPARSNRIAAIVTMVGDAAVFLGPAGVTTSTGFTLLGTAGVTVTIPGSDAIYGIVAANTEVVGVLEILA